MARGHALRERGAVAVEMAIVLPLLVLLIGGVVDFGRALYTQNIATNAAREGARARALNFSIGDANTRVSQAMIGIQAGGYVVTHELVQGAGAGTATLNGDCPSSPTVDDRVRVTVAVTNFSYIFPIPAPVPNLRSQSEMRCGG